MDGSTRVFDVTEWLVRRGRDYRVENDGGGGGAGVELGEDMETMAAPPQERIRRRRWSMGGWVCDL
jgi:hypothetical protein